MQEGKYYSFINTVKEIYEACNYHENTLLLNNKFSNLKKTLFFDKNIVKLSYKKY